MDILRLSNDIDELSFVNYDIYYYAPNTRGPMVL